MHRVVLTQPALERALPAATLRSLCGQLSPGIEAEVVRGAPAAFERARTLAGTDGAVLVTGSLHLVSDLVRAPGTRASAL
jgi:dihydrofolate synthase/folylpolyglutamate synthase